MTSPISTLESVMAQPLHEKRKGPCEQRLEIASDDTTKSNTPCSCAGKTSRKRPALSALDETNVETLEVEARIAPYAPAPGGAQPQSTMGALRCITIPDCSTLASSKRAAPAQPSSAAKARAEASMLLFESVRQDFLCVLIVCSRSAFSARSSWAATPLQ